MKKKLSKTEAKTKIETFFKQSDFTQEQMRKIKRLAMAYQIRLNDKRKLFCKSCLSPLRGKIRIKGASKTVVCENCQTINRHKLREKEYVID